MSFSFNGSSDYISASSAPGVSGADDRTIAFWLRTTANNVRQFPFAIGGDSPYARLALEFGDGGSPFSINVYSTAWNGSTVPVVDTWYHLAIVVVGNVVKLYVNGVEEVSQSQALSTATTNFSLGRFYGGSLYFSGRLAEFAKWQVALPAAAISALAKGFSPIMVRNDSLECYIPMVRDLRDVRGNAASLSATGTTVTDHPRMFSTLV